MKAFCIRQKDNALRIRKLAY